MMLLTAILFTAIVISVLNLILIYIAPLQHEYLRIGVLGYFFCLLTIYIEHLIEYAGYSCSFPHAIFISAPFYLFLFPFLNIIINAIFGQKTQWNRFLIELLPGIAYTFLMIPFFILPGDVKCTYLTNFVAENRFGSYKHMVLIGAMLIQAVIYPVVWHKKIREYVGLIKFKTSSTEIEFIPWVLWLTGVIATFTLIILLSWLARAFLPGNYYTIDQFGITVLSLIPCVFLFLLYFLPERPFPVLSTKVDTDTIEKDFSPAQRDRLKQLMTDEKLYLNADLSLSQVADIMDISRHDLSILLKQGFEMTFYGLINDYRIQHAKSLMDSELIEKFSLSGIARESGFNNYVSFYRVFKRLTKLTPSEYLKGRDN